MSVVLERFRLSAQQRQIWRTQGDRRAPYAQCVVDVTGDRVDIERLREAVSTAAGRHEILSTRFQIWPEMQEPLQVVGEPLGIGWTIVDETGSDRAEALSRARQQAYRSVQAGPPVHATCLCDGPCRVTLILTVPAMHGDERSLVVLIREIASLYDGLYNGAPLNDPVRYAAYAEWQHETGTNETGMSGSPGAATEGAGYWARLVSTPAEVPVLPGERELAPDGQDERAWVSAALDGERAGRLKDAASQIGVPLDVFVFTAFLVTISKLTNCAEPLLHIVRDGRPYEELAHAVGPFARSLPHRFAVPADARFAELAGRNARIFGVIGSYEDLFAPEHEPRPGQHHIGFEFRAIERRIDTRHASFTIAALHAAIDRWKVKLTCADEMDGTMAVEVAFDPGVWTRDAATRLADQVCTVIGSVSQQPAIAVRDLTIVGPAEAARLLEWSAGGRPRSAAPARMDAWVAAQAARVPEHVALVGADATYRYGELDAVSTQLARALRRAGVQRGDVVPLLAARGARAVAGMLGVMKAGAAYAPLNLEDPALRLTTLIREVGSGIVVGDAGSREIATAAGARLIALDEPDVWAGESIDPLPVAGGGDDLAYAIYTSGSTGRPKAVGVRHASLTQYAAGVLSRLGVTSTTTWRFAVASALHADLGHTTLFGGLASAGAVHIIDYETATAGPRLAAYLATAGIDVLKIVPSHWWALWTAAGAGVVPREWLVFGGERLRPAIAEAARAAGARVLNHYGPTETTVGCLTSDVAGLDLAGLALDAKASVPIGRPLPGAHVYVVDRDGHLAPPGVAAELWIGGAGIARGYLGQPSLTAARFVPDPWGTAGARVYRSGDRVRFGSNGAIEFLGRADDQVKVRGYRIEPGEIEAALNRHPGVRHAHVRLRPDTADAELIAYIEVQPGWMPGRDEAGRHTLPNGLAVVDGDNPTETDALYREIFEDQVYVRHGIWLPPDAIVFDAGACLGLFTLFVLQQCPGARVWAFEPIDVAAAALRANVAHHASRVNVHACGLGERRRSDTFVHYPRNWAWSGLRDRTNPAADRQEAIRLLRERGSAAPERLVDELFAPEMREAEVRRLDEAVREAGVDRIDLLKIDVQGAELDVLLGIDEETWDRIEQVVVEVHDGAAPGRLSSVMDLLRAHGFDVIADGGGVALDREGWFLVYASRARMRARRAATEAAGGSAPVPRTAGVVTSRMLRDHARTLLPDHMVPSTFVVLDSLPRTRNGKIDAQALPAPGDGAAEPIEPPATATEAALARIWAEVLQRMTVGVTQNFFDLGGHSLIATQLVSRVQEHFEVDLPLRSIFEAPTVRRLAARVAAMRMEAPSPAAPPLTPASRDTSIPLSFAQQRLWFLDRLHPLTPYYNVPIAARLTGALRIAALAESLREITRRHEILRTVVAVHEGVPSQVVHDTPADILPVIDLTVYDRRSVEERARRIAREEASRPFDLTAGPLFRARLLRLAGDEHVLLLTMHHVVADAWSVGVLTRELAAIYGAYVDGRPSPLAEPVLQYADFAVWQRRWLQGETLDRKVGWWRERLAGARELDLRTDRPRPVPATYRGGRHVIDCSPESGRALQEFSRARGVTLFMTLLAAFDVLLHCHTGQEDIVIGANVANRDRPEIEGLIGFFVNQLALRTDLSGDPSFAELLERVRQVTLDAYQHQDVPFDRIVDALKLDRRLAHAPLFQVKLDVVARQQVEAQLPGLVIRPTAPEELPAHMDLVLHVASDGESVTGAWTYNSDLFDAATIASLDGELMKIAAWAIENPTTRVSALRQRRDAWAESERRASRTESRRTAHEKLAALKRPTHAG